MPEKPVQISVERIGNKVAFQIDPELIVRPGCSCSSCSNRTVSLQEVVSALAQKEE